MNMLVAFKRADRAAQLQNPTGAPKSAGWGHGTRECGPIFDHKSTCAQSRRVSASRTPEARVLHHCTHLERAWPT